MKRSLILILAGILIIGVGSAIICVHSVFGLARFTELSKSDSELGITPTQNEVEINARQKFEDKNVVINQEEVKVKSDVEAEQKADVVNLALYGIDRRNPGEISRTDTIMVISINRKTNKVKVISLMRDMYVPIPGKQDNRINAAYAFGGPALSIKTINTLFGLDVRDYVLIDFDGLTQLIDKVGGVEIDVKPEETKLCFVDEPGLQLLNGKQALAYSRIRYVGNADYERTQRQRTVLNLLYRKVKDQGVLKLPGLIKNLLPYVETSLSGEEIFELAMDVAGFNMENLEQFRLPVDGTYVSRTIRNMMVLVPDIPENRERLHEFIYERN